MATSIFLAKLIGPLALALGLGMIFNRDAFRIVLDEFARNRALLFLAGMISFPAGLAVVLTHNVWVADWPVIITVMAWLTTFTGLLRLAAPTQAIKFGRSGYDGGKSALAGGVLWALVGAVLTFFGYFK